MDSLFINKRINTAGVVTSIKMVFLGVIVSEIWFFSQEISKYLNIYIENNNFEGQAFWVGLALLMFIILYCYIRRFTGEFRKVCKSYRFDLLILFLVGFIFSFSLNGIGTEYYRVIIKEIDPIPLFILLGVPLIIGFVLIERALQIKHTKKEEPKPFFISDVEGKTKDEDLLDHADSAIRFAERVFNGGSSESMVFGIDAPWGVGKSTFINYCIESWKDKKYEDRIILYKFNPLRYEDRTNLLEKFIDGLVITLQKSSFFPEIRPLVSKYSRLIKSKGNFSLFGIEIELSPGEYTVDDAFDDLESALVDLDKKVIVVVDDLDRLNFSAIKDVLFAIKKSFTLPNISYVLCYDTDNIISFEKGNGDIEKIREFLEKFINVKISLFLDSETLSRYVSENFKIALSNNLQIDPYTSDKLEGSIRVLTDIYKSVDFHHYQAFLGDIRKLKRLINTMMLFEIEKTDFDNSDFDKLDLVHLILIYINYPNIFRKIYNTETGGKRGFFSAVIPYDDGYPNQPRVPGERENRYENSVFFNEYITTLSKDQQFLVNKVFNVATRLPPGREIDSVSEEMKKTFACFNGDGLWTGGKNLQEYLYLIVKLAKPQKRSQYKFYLNLVDKIKNGVTLEKIFTEEEDFQFSKGEASHEQFWRIVVNTVFELKPAVGAHLITYLLKHMVDYSYYSNKDIGVGLRDDVDYFLIKLLDGAGWADPNGEHVENTEENLTEITEWIFGEGRHDKGGILETLSNEERGVIGLNDLMSFRLFCSADRGGNLFNLQRALLRYGNSSDSADANDVIKEMRKISQKVFSIFKNQYILKKKNIFQLIDELTLRDFSGKSFEFIMEQIRLEKISEAEVEKSISSMKSRIKGFVVFQLGNTMISHGIGCGYYDETGNDDKGGISVVVNEYLFEHCFNPSINENNYEYFLDYLLISFGSVFASRKGHEYVPSINEFTKVLNHSRLINYWKDNSDKIKSLNLQQKEKIIIRGDYTASYNEDLEKVFSTLDNFVQEANIQIPPTSLNK